MAGAFPPQPGLTPKALSATLSTIDIPSIESTIISFKHSDGFSTMRFSATLLLGAASAATAGTAGQRSCLMAIRGVFERQSTICQTVPAPATCEKSCGPGNIQCISFPTCYNPSAGESCCSDGNYCPADSYCTNAGCCPIGATLAECGASFTLSVILPPAATTSVPVPVPETTSSAEVITTIVSTSTSVSTIGETASTASSSSGSFPPSSATVVPSTDISALVPTPSAPSTSSHNSTSTTSSAPLQITNAAQKLGSDAAQLVLGGLGVLLMML
ncbi:uncharacterized protein L3040_000750 [Drepanopeziza brunnea f. sp. 'multigermtubi']|uniref:uncharacterized protein n=1 Tax=Drepanopeziza brunnea f. sp. 'multigermtubi' TaxID=698441 RepID=UPI0023A417B3|nr:hypothetical protein L3040_000750 [Drepanopeziza brunnea f. sp. 'multigermtubi']